MPHYPGHIASRWACVTLLFLAAEPSKAAGTTYSGLDNLVFYVPLWIAAFVVSVVIRIQATSNVAKTISAGIAIALCILPLVLFSVAMSRGTRHTDIAHANAVAESQFCTANRSSKVTPVLDTSPITLTVITSDAFSSFRSAGIATEAVKVAEFLRKNYHICSQSRIRFVLVSKTRSGDSPAQESAGDATRMQCSPPTEANADKREARHFLLYIGEDWQEKQFPEIEEWGRTSMGRASMRVIESGSALAVAYDNGMHLLSSQFGRSFDCSHFERVLPETLAQVFPK